MMVFKECVKWETNKNGENVFEKRKGSDLPRSSPSLHTSLLTEPTRDDEGAGRRVELSRRSRESLAAHLGARRGGAEWWSAQEGE